MTAIPHETETFLAPHRAAQKFGDLARIRNGVTTWIEVEVEGGTWKPVFSDGVSGFLLIGYRWEANE